ncbi:MAG: EamA family transporter [Betaproteobacteria bacterium HGW-Betaproteobacteria-3]|jgi:drug/metabolite transporter (DMT)-like permease|nr:MAG: EamA family transporter [Betaproteobacteria bacterium HGW-Betaproteobacteria-3]
MRFSSRTVGLAAAVITVVIWTAFIVVARASATGAHGGTLTPLDIAFARILGASLVLLPLGAWLVRRQRLPGWLGLSPLPFRVTAQIGVLGGLLYALLAYTGFFYAPAAHASVLLPGSLPLWTALLAIGVLGERIGRARALGLVLIVAGGLLVGGASLLRAFEGGEVWKGDLLFMAAAFCWSSYSVLVRRHGLDAVKATVAITVFAALTYLPVYSALALSGVAGSHLAAAPWREIAFQALFQGVGSVVISGITFTQMIRHFGPVKSTMITALVPGLSALAAVVLLGEPLGWNLWAGLALVTGGIVFGVRGLALKAPELIANSDQSVRAKA